MSASPDKVSVAVPRSASPVWGILTLIVLVAGPLALSILNLIFYPVSTMGGLGVRYWLLPWMVFTWLFIAGVRYVKYAYGLKTMSASFQYLLAAMIGLQRPTGVIRSGKAQVGDGTTENPIFAIGGPGYLLVETGNVALLENYAGRVRVIGPGRHYVTHLERFKEAASLEERLANVEKISAISKDGIEVVASSVQYRYCLFRGLPPDNLEERTPQTIYRYTEDAVKNMVYNRNMTATEILPWHHGVNHSVDTAIVDYIRLHQVDQIIVGGLQGSDPRSEIYQQLKSKGTRERFMDRGAELIWIDIGYLGVPDKQVMEQRILNWQTRLMSDANVVRAYGEAQRIEYQEKGKAEAQVDMINAMIKALEDLEKEGIPRQQLRTLYLARLGQLLETTLGRPALSPGEELLYQ